MDKCRRVGFLIKLISEKTDKYISADLKDKKISMTQMFILAFLKNRKDISTSQKDIEKYLCVSHPTVVGVLKVMENKGLIICTFDKKDRRRKNVVLTEKANEVFLPIRKTQMKMKDKTFEGFSDEEIDKLLDLLEKIRKNIE